MFILSRKQQKHQMPAQVLVHQTQPRQSPLSAKEWFDLQVLAKGHLISQRPPIEAVSGLIAWRISPDTERERLLARGLEAGQILIAQNDFWRLTAYGLRQVLAVIRHLSPAENTQSRL
jgi:hypothetical protein